MRYTAIDRQINHYGTSVTVVTPRGTIYTDDWGNRSYTTANKRIVAVINDVSGQESWNTEGLFGPDDKIFFVKSTDTVEKDSFILHASNYYRVVQVIRHNVKNQDQQAEVRAKYVGDSIDSVDGSI
jgi:hypothetical protein